MFVYIVIFISFIIFSGELNVDRICLCIEFISGKKKIYQKYIKIYKMFQKFLTSHMAFSHNVFRKFHTVSRTYIGMHDMW